MARITISRNGEAPALPPAPVKGKRPWKKDTPTLSPPDPHRRVHGDHAIRMDEKDGPYRLQPRAYTAGQDRRRG